MIVEKPKLWIFGSGSEGGNESSQGGKGMCVYVRCESLCVCIMCLFGGVIVEKPGSKLWIFG